MEAVAKKPIQRFGEHVQPITSVNLHICNLSNVKIAVQTYRRPDGSEYDTIKIAGTTTLFLDREQSVELRDALSRMIDGEVR